VKENSLVKSVCLDGICIFAFVDVIKEKFDYGTDQYVENAAQNSENY